jgi:N-acetylglucosaminyl-diphospho-decaprenol L-rhamnosyltransferase
LDGATIDSVAGRVGAVVVNHNAGSALLTCIASIRLAGVTDIVVVDNDSSDDSLVALSSADPAVGVVRVGSNPGYGTAVNRGREYLSDEYVLVCNPDLEIDAKAVLRLVECLDADREVGVVGPGVFEMNGETYPSARSFPDVPNALGHALFGMFRPDNRFTVRYKMRAVALGEPSEVDWVSGACFMVRGLAYDSVGGFDEKFFMYVEDLDLCWRLRRAGWRVRYEPSAHVVHLGGLSAARHPYKMLFAHHVSTWRFAYKSLNGSQRALLPLVAIGLAARFFVAAVQRAIR